MMLIPPALFFALLLFGREDLGVKGILIAMGVWLGLLVLFGALRLSPHFFIIAEGMLDIVLILIIFGGDIRLRP